MKRKDFLTEIKDLSVAELNEKLADFKSELFNLRFQAAIQQLENPMRIKEVRKNMARIKTELAKREASDSAKQ